MKGKVLQLVVSDRTKLSGGQKMNARMLIACSVCLCGAACSLAPAPIPSMFVCVNSPSWRFLSSPPEDAATLYARIGRRAGLSDYPGESRDHWLLSDGGELRLCRQRLEATDFCGSASVTFTLVDNEWQPQPGVSIPACGVSQ